MASSYSLDLRKKAIEAIEKGSGLMEVSRLLQINRRTLYEWKELKKINGSLEPRKMAAEKRNRKIEEMAQKWPEPISSVTIRRLLHKLGFTVKKNVWIL